MRIKFKNTTLEFEFEGSVEEYDASIRSLILNIEHPLQPVSVPKEPVEAIEEKKVEQTPVPEAKSAEESCERSIDVDDFIAKLSVKLHAEMLDKHSIRRIVTIWWMHLIDRPVSIANIFTKFKEFYPSNPAVWQFICSQTCMTKVRRGYYTVDWDKVPEEVKGATKQRPRS